MKISYYVARRLIFTAFVSVSLIALGAALSSMAALDKYGALAKEMRDLDTKYVSVEAECDRCFIVREHEGIIGVFNSDGDLEYTVEIYVKTLPEADRSLLSSGIFAKNKAELLEILGDYDG